MVILTGMRNAEYLSKFLGKKIAIKAADGVYEIYPCLTEIHSNHSVIVVDSEGHRFRFPWNKCESPHVILSENVEIKIK